MVAVTAAKNKLPMKKRSLFRLVIVLSVGALAVVVTACDPSAAPSTGQPASAASSASAAAELKVLAAESFIADMAQNVAGDRLKVETLMPLGLDPHAFQPTPQDVGRIADSQVLIVNGGGFEGWLQEVLDNAGGERQVIAASAGLTSRQVREGEAANMTEEERAAGDPHFWLDPTHVIKYVENIRDGLSQADPAGKDIYAKNAEAYIAKLKELDTWIAEQVQSIPTERRQIVTNHESFGYFADRYGFTISGTVGPSVSTGSSPSAQELASLVDRIKATGAPAIFLETGANPKLAEQVAEETGVTVVTDLMSHSITPPDGLAPTYLDMMRLNTQAFVNALKP